MKYLPTLNNGNKWKCESDRNLQKGDLVWLIEDSDKRSATVQTKDGVYRRPVVKLALVLPIDEDVFMKENRAGDVEAELPQHA